MDAISFEKIADIPAFPGEYSLATRTVADDGTVLFLFVESAASEAVFGNDTRPATYVSPARMNAPTKFRLVGVRQDWHYVIDLPPLDASFPLVDVFPSGKVLVAAARCQWRSKDDYDLNGVVYDLATGEVSRILLGDGIERVYVDRRGIIWVSYFDEGVFGNFGWGGPGPAPIGSAGLACFSETGKKIWEAPWDIVDCYALNVCGSEALVYYYSAFPICRVSDGFQVTRWNTALRGCHELAATRSRVLLSGQYDDPAGVGYLGLLQQDQLKDVQRVRLLLPDGSSVPEKKSLLGRGRHMYCFDASGVYRSTLE